MADYTSLHRVTGSPPGPVTDEMVQRAVDDGVEEAGDLDWKRDRPPAKGLAETDAPKDVAAMANSGGGVVVYGVTESGAGAAKGRVDVGPVSDADRRAFTTMASRAIHPPVYGVQALVVGPSGRQALVVLVPASDAVPHSIYRNDYFGAPFRSGPDTIWMRETQLAAAYRERFDAQRAGEAALADLYDDAVTRGDHKHVAWMYGVARPRIASSGGVRPTRQDAQEWLSRAHGRATTWLIRGWPYSPLDGATKAEGPRIGLRRWETPIAYEGMGGGFHESWAAVHDNGSVALGWAIGGHPLNLQKGEFANPTMIEARRCEVLVAELAALVRIGVEDGRHVDHEIQIGIEWTGSGDPLNFEIRSESFAGLIDTRGRELARFRPVRASLRHDLDDPDFRLQVCDVAEDVVNQAGFTELLMLPRELPIYR